MQVVVSRGDRHVALATGEEGTRLSYYASASEMNKYWHSVFPKTSIPSAVLDRFNAPSDQVSRENTKILHNWAHRVASEKLLFPENVFTVGAQINLNIDRADGLHTPWLHPDIGDSIVMSTNNFTDTATTFAPVSASMARDMWSTLSSCEHPRELSSEQKACAASVGSMHEFVVSALGTGDLHAVSTSLDVPEEGIRSPSYMYKVATVRAVSAHGDKAATNTVTCHSMSFPFALFYCHTVNPTRIYEVTLQREEDGVVIASPRTPAVVRRALAVCHVNTLGFDPTLKYWVKLGARPGEASVCHFLTRGDVLWAPTSAS
nr:unnamed protein product [Digitaria exilis]